ncbi:hypothetical protein [Blastococcus sp. SYSU D01042]
MSTDGRTSPEQRSGATRRPPPDPLQMSAAEKVMAEWEARHDVAARGHRGSPEALQHYFDRSRLTPPPQPGTPPPAARPQAERRSDPAPADPAPPRPRSGSLLDRLLHRSR